MTFALARLGEAGHERPFVIVDGVASSIESVTDDIDAAFLDGGGVERVRAALKELPTARPVESLGLRHGPPLTRPGNVVCVGLNYRDHAEETHSPMPAEPILFMKDPSTVIGANDEVLVPRLSVKTDWSLSCSRRTSLATSSSSKGSWPRIGLARWRSSPEVKQSGGSRSCG